jgi:hypothetical protein
MNGKQCGLILLTLSLLFMASCGISKTNISNIVSQNPSNTEEQTKKIKYVLGEFSLTNGTDYLSAPVSAGSANKWRNGSGSPSEYGDFKGKNGGYAVVHNYVFVNRQDLSSRKLFPDNKFVILEGQEIGETITQGKGADQKTIIKNVKAVLYQVIKADTNGDKALDSKDKMAITLADVNGNNKELITGIDSLINIHAQSNNKRVVFYKTGQEYFAASIDIPSKSVQVKKLQSIVD